MSRSINASHSIAGRADGPAPPEPASLMLTAAALVCIGVVMILSAGSGVAGHGGIVGCDAAEMFKRFWSEPGLRQSLFVPPALLLMWLTSRLYPQFWRMRRRWLLSPAVWLTATAVVLLVLVLLFGPRINGAKRWFRVSAAGFSFNLQPSELAKLSLILLIAAVLSDSRYNVRRFLTGLVPLLAIIGLTVVLIIKEDFGTAFLIAIVVAFLLLAGGARLWHLLALIPPVALGGLCFLLFGSHSANRQERVTSWWHGARDTAAWQHVHQSLVAIASGGFGGQGLGQGIQKLGYVPEDTTDFIFPIICEELGLIGGFVIIGLFVLLLWLLRCAMVSARDRLGQLIVLGVTLLIGFQAAMNIAVVTGAIPPKGIALPFVSSGGSGLLIMSIALGLAAGVARQAKADRAG